MEPFVKVVRIGEKRPAWTKRGFDVFCKIDWDGKSLFITGVEGPLKNGECRGSCDQIIIGGLGEFASFAPGWDQEKLDRFAEVWDRWHLNNLRAGTPEQCQAVKEYRESLGPDALYRGEFSAVCEHLESINLFAVPDPRPGMEGRSYLYGHGWLTEPVPDEVLEFLMSLPDTDKEPAWV